MARKMHPVSKELTAAAKTFEQKNNEYGDSYKTKGEIMAAYFPGGITLETPDDFARFAMLSGVIGKMHRYSANFFNGGHQDSLRDASVYSAMLQDLDGAIE